MENWAPGQKVVIKEFGESPLDALENQLVMVPQEAPDPSDLKPKDVIIKVKSAAVGWVDLIMSSGQYQHMAKPPYTPGLEYTGDVLWAGPEAIEKGVNVGDSVIAVGLLTGPRSKGDYQQFGGFASYAVAPVEGVLKLPETFTYHQGSCFLGNYETAYHCLVTCGQIQAGEAVLIHGASGSTGLAAVHIAKIKGATVIATGRSEEKLKIVAEQGADHVICTSEEQGGLRSLRDKVKALTDGAGVDLVYDGVGGAISTASLRCVKFGARFLIVGWASTPFVAKGKGQRGSPNANQLPTNLIMMKGLKVLGCPMAISTHRDPRIREARIHQLLEWTKDRRLAPHVGPEFEFDQIIDALKAKWSSQFVGGCVININ
jgi:NADPH:quinone reductase